MLSKEAVENRESELREMFGLNVASVKKGKGSPFFAHHHSMIVHISTIIFFVPLPLSLQTK